MLTSGPIQKVWGGEGGASGPDIRKVGGGAVRFRSDIRKVGGASGPIYETGADTGILKGGGGGSNMKNK